MIMITKFSYLTHARLSTSGENYNQSLRTVYFWRPFPSWFISRIPPRQRQAGYCINSTQTARCKLYNKPHCHRRHMWHTLLVENSLVRMTLRLSGSVFGCFITAIVTPDIRASHAWLRTTVERRVAAVFGTRKNPLVCVHSAPVERLELLRRVRNPFGRRYSILSDRSVIEDGSARGRRWCINNKRRCGGGGDCRTVPGCVRAISKRPTQRCEEYKKCGPLPAVYYASHRPWFHSSICISNPRSKAH